jgi:hypothetical protein
LARAGFDGTLHVAAQDSVLGPLPVEAPSRTQFMLKI